jgi:hypothetical protein
MPRPDDLRAVMRMVAPHGWHVAIHVFGKGRPVLRPRPSWQTRRRPVSRRRKKKLHKEPQKKVMSSVVVVVTNSRSVALSELDATPSGETLPKTIVSNLAPGQKISVIVAAVKSCVFNLHGAYADGSNTDSTSIDLCKDKNVNLIE